MKKLILFSVAAFFLGIGGAFVFQSRSSVPVVKPPIVDTTGTISSGQVTVGVPKPDGLSKYPDLPLGNLDLSKPLSVKAVAEHRTALNDKSVIVNGLVVSTLLGEAACPSGNDPLRPGPGGCGQPRIVLADTIEASRDTNYDLTVLLNERDQGYTVGQAVTVAGIVSSSKEAVVVRKIQ
ncbi:hypothetical protein HY086_01010 [Candidatus Gottesmanbacteria bacterium]|nr:hypothetical protein [Candidatus Gottesmanbacteria bacterium]